ncbi:MAG: peptidoglycan-binding domain-containing protein [Pseudomonadota bacterium]|nr:peptidoglycan-binding domain-containing protein [Pseudomonadota bacterium]
MSNNSYSDYLQALARRESGGAVAAGRDPYQEVNYAGYLGKYQMGELALIDAGYYKKDGTSRNDWKGEWTGKDGIDSKEDFLKSPQAQENAINSYNQKQWSYIRHYDLDKYIGKTLDDGQKITASGLLAGAHLVGVGELKNYLQSNGNTVPKDGNGTKISKYVHDMGDFDITQIMSPQQQKHVADQLPTHSASQESVSKVHVNRPHDLGERYQITESVGRRREQVHSYEDLEKHHPSAGLEKGRDYAMVEGRLEEVKYTDDHRTLVKKDMILSVNGKSNVDVPSPAAGWVYYDNKYGTANIYDQPRDQGGKLVAQVMHMKPESFKHSGQHVEFGEPIGIQGGQGPKGPNHYGVHVHMAATPEIFKNYIHAMETGAIRAEMHPPSLSQTSKNKGEVEQLQDNLTVLGFAGQNGLPLKPDGRFGPQTEHAVREFQKAHDLVPDGIVGRHTREALDEALARHEAQKLQPDVSAPASPAHTHPADPLHIRSRLPEFLYPLHDKVVDALSRSGLSAAQHEQVSGYCALQCHKQDMPLHQVDSITTMDFRGKHLLVMHNHDQSERVSADINKALATPLEQSLAAAQPPVQEHQHRHAMVM